MTNTRRIRLELCVASLEDAQVAQRSGVDRIELNSALGLGGLTPSLGTLMEVKQAVTLPVLVMIRPREAGFSYTAGEFRVKERDLDLALEHGADGVVFGVLNEDGTVDRARCRRLVERVGGRAEVVFHRAFDVTPDPFEALEQLIDLGFQRILTSGQEQSAYNGSALIAELVRRGRGRIEILPAGGINRFTIQDVLERTGCDQVHASLRALRFDRSTEQRPQVGFGGAFRPPEDRFEGTDPNAVATLRGLLDHATSRGR